MNQIPNRRAPVQATGLVLGLAGLAALLPVPGLAVTPEEYGAVGDGRVDDTGAMRAALAAAQGDILTLGSGRRYRLLEPLSIDAKTRLTGSGVLLGTPELAAAIGPVSDTGVLTVAPGAEGSEIDGITIDLAGIGRTALQVNADSVVVSNVEVRDYAKSVKADGRRYSTSDSGVRIHGDDVVVSGFRCLDMRTGQPDSSPRCVTVQGGARAARLSEISGERVNGGITVGRSSDTQIRGWRFRELEDNGLYVLPDAERTVAVDGQLEDTEEPAVFKGRGTRVRGLKVINQGRAFGIENARDLVLESVQVDYRPGFNATPAFIRSRRGNKASADIVVKDVSGRMLLGDAVVSLAQGSVAGFEATNWKLVLEAGAGSKHRRFALRHSAGLPAPRFTDVTLEVAGPADRLPGSLAISLASGADAAAVLDGLAVRLGGKTVVPQVN